MSPAFKSPLSIVAAAVLVGCANTPQPGARMVQIDRTTYGIAHVTASDYEGIGYGVAYAYAQDNLCLTAEHLLTLRGDRTRFLGAQGSGEIGLARLPNPQVDLFIRAHMDDAALARAAATSSPELHASVRGYIAGYNRYLQEAIAAGTVPESCRGKPWLQCPPQKCRPTQRCVPR
jgi:acyl-homoserine-lactone acylase